MLYLLSYASLMVSFLLCFDALSEPMMFSLFLFVLSYATLYNVLLFSL